MAQMQLMKRKSGRNNMTDQERITNLEKQMTGLVLCLEKLSKLTVFEIQNLLLAEWKPLQIVNGANQSTSLVGSPLPDPLLLDSKTPH